MKLKLIRNNPLLKVVAQTNRQLLPSQRKKALFTIILILCNAAFDVLSLASILPFVFLVLDPSEIKANPYLGFFYHAFSFKSEKTFLLAAFLLLLLVFIVKNAVGVAITYFQSRFVYDVATSLAERQLWRYYARDYLFFVDASSSLPARDVLHVPIEFSIYILLAGITFLAELVVFLLIALGVAIYNVEIFFLLLLALGPALLLAFQRKRDKLGEIGKITKTLQPLAIKNLFHGITGYVDIKLYRKENYFVKKFAGLQSALNKNFAVFHTVSVLPARLIEVAMVLGLVILLIYGMFMERGRNELVVLLSIFTAAAYRLMPSINRMFIALANIKTFRHSLDILQGVENIPAASPVRDTVPPEPLCFNQCLAFRNVSFSYSDPARFGLKNVSFVVKKGETVGFVGKSGAGKTTIINILLRFLIEQSGEIVVDGRPLSSADTPAWRTLIGYVQQHPFLLDGTIAENIAFGEEKAEMNRAKIEQAIQQAGLADFMAGLPCGIETPIGEHGAKLSGGQRQRLAIARALYRNSEILIFDEATSELDDQTEREVTEAISRLSEYSKTILIIAHRVTTLKHCDRIYKLEDGEITGAYDYAEWLKHAGHVQIY
jgi:ABC-type multidrug transport system fused ATPase/permease subunit